MATEHVESVSTAFDIASPAYVTYQTLIELSLNNASYFAADDSENGQRFHAAFLAIVDHVNAVAPLVDEVRKAAPSFDLDAETAGNGYRSFVAVVDMCVAHGVNLNTHIMHTRDSFLFWRNSYMREVEACSHVMASLGTCMQHLKTLLSWSQPGLLFPADAHSPEELLKQTESINMYCFYGRCLGFQFCESMQTVLKTISICMASFSEIYFGNGGGLLSLATHSVLNGGKYLLDPELRARRIVNISQNASVDFCKSFWLLSESEVMSCLPGMICPAVAVNKVIMLPPEPLEHEHPNGTKVNIPIPNSHMGPAPLQVRLLSAMRREGMIGEMKERTQTKLHPPSDSLIIHAHGGGFVAQSSRSHETYLRDWACQLAVPILSVDYSLAPQAPFPRALEEMVYAYCWALKNASILGTTAKKVILIGDSAGGTLNLGLAMKCIELGIQPPSGLFVLYVPVLIAFVPSPSRLLCLMDPLLPFGFMIRCLKAYACPSEDNSEHMSSTDSKGTMSSMKTSIIASSPSDTLEISDKKKELSQSANSHIIGSDTESFEEVSESDLMELAAHKSPMSELGSDTLTTVSLTSLQSKPELDQLLPVLSEEVAGGTSTDSTKADASTSEKYVSDFLEKYVLDSETDSEGRKIPVLRTEEVCAEVDEHVLFELPQDMGISAKLGRAAGNIANGVTNTFYYMTGKKSPESTKSGNQSTSSPSKRTLQVSSLDSMIQRSPSQEFCFTLPEDPYLSPYWVSDDILQQFPPMGILTTQLDPCLDDCIMFAKRLRKLGKTVTLDIVGGLPHGFLNFVRLSKDAYNASNLCVKRIQELFAAVGKDPSPK